VPTTLRPMSTVAAPDPRDLVEDVLSRLPDLPTLDAASLGAPHGILLSRPAEARRRLSDEVPTQDDDEDEDEDEDDDWDEDDDDWDEDDDDDDDDWDEDDDDDDDDDLDDDEDDDDWDDDDENDEEEEEDEDEDEEDEDAPPARPTRARPSVPSAPARRRR